MKAFAIDLGGSHATLALMDGETIVARELVEIVGDVPIGPELPRIAKAVRGLADRAGVRLADTAGIGWGFPALVDGVNDRVMSTNKKYEDAASVDFPAWAKQELGLRLKLENDARMALLGEQASGAARGYGDVFLFTLGTGIGGVAMMEGKLVRGKHAQAGCLGGHVPVLFSGRACTCGSIGCAEAEAAGWSLPLVAKDWPGFAASALGKEPKVSFEALFRCARAGDSVSVALRDRCIAVWAAAAVAAVHSFDPELVVYGGGVMAAASLAGSKKSIRAIDDRRPNTGSSPSSGASLASSAAGDR